MVHLYNFSENLKPKSSKVIKQVTDKLNIGISTSLEQAEVSYINNTNKLNSSKVNKQSQNSKKETLDLKNQEDDTKQKKLRQKNKSSIIPNEQELVKYFRNKTF